MSGNNPSIALIGYGKMGREIERAAMESGFPVNAIIDVGLAGRTATLSAAALRAVDVCIEFSTPSSVVENIRACAQAGKPVVVGTTGWHDRIGEVEAVVRDAGIGLIHASNFSIGVHLFLAMVEHAARTMERHPQYDAALHETHHRMKKDAPSGTALTIAETLLGQLSRKERILTLLPGDAPAETDLCVSSARIGTVPGTHTVLFDSMADSIEITHTARSRRGFADGALLAARWIATRTGMYTIQDMLHDIESV